MTLKTKIISATLLSGAYTFVLSAIDNTKAVLQKYSALTQFDNSELSFQLFQMLAKISYLNGFLVTSWILFLITLFLESKKTLSVEETEQ